ncbi:MAG TPA: glycosyltransferase family 4 protein [Luteibacter sp.]|jgi:glycosyltransferase involved in cell wall biosynthesis|uniref:glycosyltransferase family 4 protein n=1 Tax=Luteibacter sp. TaxID=1886636 RepID=UPI002F416A7A
MSSDFGAILLDGELRDREASKAPGRPERLQGFDVFLEGFSRALFTRSQHGPVLLPREALLASRGTMPRWFPDVQAKVRSVAAGDPRALDAWERLLLLSIGPEMLQYAWMREDAGRPDWPITAILHSPQPIPRIRYLFTNHLLGTLGRHDALVCPSHAARKVIEASFRAVPRALRSTDDLPMELPVIPMGVDSADWQATSREEARRALALPATGPIVLWFGRLSPSDKGEMLPFLRALAPTLEQHNARLVMAGDDSSHHLAGTLRELAEELGYGERFAVFPDVTRAMKQTLFQAADIFLGLACTMHEGFSLTIAEAMASGLPIIASDWAGHREWVEDGVSGYLIPTYLPSGSGHSVITLYAGAAQENYWELSTVTDLAVLQQTVDALLGDSQMRARMGEAAQRFARETFDWDVVMRSYDTLWQEQFARAAHLRRHSPVRPQVSLPAIFTSYPTRSMRATDVLGIPQGAPGDDFLPALADARYFRQDVFRQILRAFHDRAGSGSLTDITSDVLDAFPGALHSSDVERHIGRLLKHGLLEMAREASSTSPLPLTVNAN